MSNERKNRLTARFRKKNTPSEQPSILQSKEETRQKRWGWQQVAFLCLVIYASISFMNGCFSIVALKAQENQVLAQTQEAEKEKERLENEVSYMQTQEAIEKTAREDLKMVKPGEIRLVQKENASDKEKNTDHKGS